jgi:hypothetical protein
VYVSLRLDIVNKLGPWLLIWWRDQLSEGPVDCDEKPVPLIETEALQQDAIGPPCKSFFDNAGEPIEAVRTVPANAIRYVGLQVGRVEFPVVVERKGMGSPQQFARK